MNPWKYILLGFIDLTYMAFLWGHDMQADKLAYLGACVILTIHVIAAGLLILAGIESLREWKEGFK